MNYLIKVGRKEIIVKPYQIKSVIDDMVIFDYVSINKSSIIRNVKGFFVCFI
jgi:hypothetical protein